MPNFADLHRQQQKAAVTSAKAVVELNQNYADRENKVNGFAGGAGEILARISPSNNTAKFGMSGGKTAGA